MVLPQCVSRNRNPLYGMRVGCDSIPLPISARNRLRSSGCLASPGGIFEDLLNKSAYRHRTSDLSAECRA